MLTPWCALLIGWAVVALIMFLLYFDQRRTGQADVVDVGWAANLGLLAIFYALVLDGYLWRRAIVATLMGCWSFRLTWYLYRNRYLNPEEDGRYQDLREYWKPKEQFKFLIFFQAQGLLDVILSLPVFIICLDERAAIGVWDVIGILIWVISITGESIADHQLSTFRADPENRGKTCQVGLWRYSRHPNYFFEWIHWWAYAALAVGSSWWWLPFISVGLMLYLILNITGIPPTEERAAASRPDYAEYQATTSAFVPWFRKDRK